MADPGRPTNGAYAVRLSYQFRTPAEEPKSSGYHTRTELPKPLAPGESVAIPVTVQAPAASGDYVLQFELVQELHAWFASKGAAQLAIPVSVR